MKFVIYKNRKKEWCLRLVGRNGEKIVWAEGYKRRKDCFHAIKLVMRTNADTPVDFPNKA